MRPRSPPRSAYRRTAVPVPGLTRLSEPGLYDVKQQAQTFSSRNGGPSTLVQCGTTSGGLTNRDQDNCYATPYVDAGGTHTNLVYVRLVKPVSTFFTGVVGLGNVFHVSARSVGAAAGVTGIHITPGFTTTGTTIDPTTIYTTTTTPGVAGGGVAFAKSTACGNSDTSAALSYSGAGGGQIGALETNGGFYGTAGTGSAKTIGSLGIGKLGTTGCDVESGPITINAKYGPFNKDWPVPPPNPAPPPGCTNLGATYVIAGKSLSGTTVTLTTSATTPMAIGDSVIVNIGDSRFDGVHTVTAKPSTTTFRYTANAFTASANVTNKSVASDVATLTTNAPHGYQVGDTVTVNLGDPRFDGLVTITAVPSSTSLSYTPTVIHTTQWSVTGATATLTTAGAHGLQVGDVVTVGGFSGQRTFLNVANASVTAVTGSTFAYTVPGGHSGTSGANAGTATIVTVAPAPATGTVTLSGVNATANGIVNDTTVAPSTSDFTVSGNWSRADGGAYPPGVYCLTGPITTDLNISDNNANLIGYSFYAPSITVSSNGQTVSPATGDPTVLDAYLGDLNLNGNGSTSSGYIFAPNGAANVSGGGVSAGSGFIEAQTIHLSGNFANFTGTGPTSAGSTSTLPIGTIPGTTVTGTTQSGTTQTVTTGTTVGLSE